MWVAALLPFVAGTLVATRLLQERGFLRVAAVAYGLGIAFFLALLNLFIHFIPFTVAVPSTLISCGVIALVVLCRRAWRRTPVRDPLSAFEIALLVLALSTIFAYDFLKLGMCLDDDYWIHSTNTSLLGRDVFPPINPFFPELPLKGHYGRALLLAGIGSALDCHYFTTIYLSVLLSQLSSFVLIYSAFRRLTRSVSQASLASMFLFFGMHVGFREFNIRPGAVDLIYNNLALTTLFFSLTVYLFSRFFTSRNKSAVLVLLTVSLAVYAYVYDTVFACLLASLFVTPWFLRRYPSRLRMRVAIAFGVCGIVAGLLSCVEGGAFTELTRSRLGPLLHLETPAPPASLSGLTQDIHIHFPKKDLGCITVPTVGERWVFSDGFVRDQGWAFRLWPLVLAWSVWAARPLPLYLMLFGFISLAIPASFDFGRFNAEAPRFVVAAAMGFACAFGAMLGIVYDRLCALARGGRHGRALIVAMTVAVAAIALGCFTLSAKMFGEVQALALTNTSVFVFNYDQALLRQEMTDDLSLDDPALLARLRSLNRPTDRLLSNVKDVEKWGLGTATMLWMSGCTATGVGVVEPDRTMQGLWLEPQSLKSRAFWRTLDTWRALELQADWLYVCTDRLSDAALHRLHADKAFRLRGATSRVYSPHRHELYEVVQKSKRVAPVPLSPAVVRVTRLRLPASLDRGEAADASLTMTAAETFESAGWRLCCIMRYADGHQANAMDELPIQVPERLVAGQEYTLSFPFLAPFQTGEVSLGFVLVSAHGERLDVTLSAEAAAAAHCLVTGEPLK